jgi:hypothetical protein
MSVPSQGEKVIMIEPHIQLITLPTFGRCTMLPLSILPEKMRSYKRIWESAQHMGLKEFDDLSHKEIQEIAKCVALHFRKSGSVWLSGVVDAYPRIFPNVQNQEPEKCIPSIELMAFDLPAVETYVCYIPIESVRVVGEREIVVCLFRGSD